MGKSIDKTEFAPVDFALFQQRLHDNLIKLEELISTPGFGTGPTSFGAELELYAIDHKGLPVMCNQAVKQAFQDDRLTLELNRYNLEYNLSPVLASGRPFSALRQEMETALQRLDKVAANYQASIIPIGILPTLTTDNLGMHAITDLPRYHVLANSLRKRRGSDFHIQISGEEKLDMHWGDVTPEGANTSFQFHYRVDPEHFRDAFNAAQLVTPLGVALAANSPFFLGKKLWHETRVALFKQSIDCRMGDPLSMRLPPRVYFGNGWVRQGIYELFSEGIYLFSPLFPQCKDPEENRYPPELYELCLHHGSIWTWNRPIYDSTGAGHLRIELRALPAGPTPVDMLATAAFTIGLIEELSKQINTILPGIPFRYAEHNFFRTAKDGLNAKLFWPNFDANCIEERPVTDILEELMPLAETGLRHLGVNDDEINTYLRVANNTLIKRQNGAIWQLETLRKLEHNNDRYTALQGLVQRYQSNYLDGAPVHQWR
jgi:gamma-glutamyl:cysteine ligase YbdK (ATP-grasp superfamily)